MKYLILALTLSFVCSCKQANDKNIQLVTVDVAKDYQPKEVWLQDIADIEYIPLATSDSMLVNSTPSVVSDKGIAIRGGKIGGKNQITDEKLKAIASQLHEEDNPVLMVLKFKE